MGQREENLDNFRFCLCKGAEVNKHASIKVFLSFFFFSPDWETRRMKFKTPTSVK